MRLRPLLASLLLATTFAAQAAPDTLPRRLLISVDNTDSNLQDTRDGRTIRYGTTNRDGGLMQVQALEGKPALIQVGQSVPITRTGTDSYGELQSYTEQRNVTQGFYATANLDDGMVQVAISTNNDRISSERADVVNVQSTDTTVRGRLGEWITVAGFNRQSQAGHTRSRHYSTQRGENMTLRLRVDALD